MFGEPLIYAIPSIMSFGFVVVTLTVGLESPPELAAVGRPLSNGEEVFAPDIPKIFRVATFWALSVKVTLSPESGTVDIA
jgi:hypothetical protein